MPVQKFRDVSEMPRPPRVTGPALSARIAAVWNQASRLASLGYPPGVYRFRDLEQAQAARRRVQIERMRSGKPRHDG